MKKVRNQEELVEAIKNNEESIEIEGDLVHKTIKIKARGKVAWAIAIGSIGVAVLALLIASKSSKTNLLASIPPSQEAVGILDFDATTVIIVIAIIIAIIGGGIAILNQLKNYNLEKISDHNVILRRK